MKQNSSTRLWLLLTIVTVVVMGIFVGVRTYMSWTQMEKDLEHRARSIAERVSGAVRPTIWNIYRKSEKRQFTEEIASAIVDAELKDEFVRAIYVYGNFGHLFTARVKTEDDKIVSISSKDFRPTGRDTAQFAKQPVRQGVMTIGTVEVEYSHAPYVRRFQVSLLLEVAQVAVVSLLFVAFLFWAIRQSLLLPTKKLQISESAVNAMREGVIVLDARDRVLDVNPSFLTMMGYDEADLLTKELALNDIFTDLPIDIATARKVDKDWRGDVTAKSKNGESFSASLNINLVKGEHGDETIKVLVVEDISERLRYQSELQSAHDDLSHLVSERTRQLNDIKRTEERLRTSLAEIEKANAAKSQFLANMSHELRTPLNTIIGYSETLLLKLFGDFSTSKQREYVQDIKSSGSHLLSLINDILDISKIESQTLKLQEDRIRARSVMEVARAQVEQKALKKNVSLDTSDETSDATLLGDRRRVSQILINLLDNAVKFTPSGGSVSITARVDGTGKMQFEIQDSGIGIPADKIDVVLKPFEQVGDVNNTPQSGTGLGLSICKSLVELHGGSLVIESEPGVGTKIIVCFPAQRTIRSTH